MTKKTKIIIGVVTGLLLIGGISYMVYNNRRKKKLLEELDMEVESGGYEVDETTGEVVKTTGSTGAGTTAAAEPPKPSFPMGRISPRPSGKHAVHLNKRPPAGTIVAGDKVKITKTTFDNTYHVSDAWIDANGNIGAIYLSIPYTPTGKDDPKFANKGVITLV